MHTYLNMHPYIHTPMCAHTCAYLSSCMPVYTHITNTCTPINTYPYLHTQQENSPSSLISSAHRHCMHTHMHIYTHIHTPIFIHTYTHLLCTYTKHISMFIYITIWIYPYSPTCTDIYMLIYTRPYLFTHTYTYTPYASTLPHTLAHAYTPIHIHYYL